MDGFYLCNLLVKMLKSISDEGDVLFGLRVVLSPEGRHSGEHDVGEHAHRPDVCLRVRWLVVYNLWGWNTKI